MKITFVLSYAGLSGGIRVVGVLAQRLKERGHDVTIVSRRTPAIGGRDLARHMMRDAWRRFRGKPELSHLNDIGVEHIRIPGRAEMADHHVPDADVIVATWWETAEWISRLSPAKGAKAYFLQGYEVHGNQPRDRVRATWRLPMHKIAVSQWLVDIARDDFDDPDVSLVPNSVDLELFNADLRCHQDEPTVGMLYRPMHCKGCDIGIEAYNRARKEIPQLRFKSFGANPAVAAMPLPADSEYTLRPEQADIPSIYSSCDVWLFPSRAEGFGLPLVEAMACRTPVIATPAGAAPQLVTEDVGMLVPHEDPQAMADAVVQFMRMSEEKWRTYSAAARAAVAAYTWEHATDRFEAALARAVEKREAHGPLWEAAA